MSSSGNSLEPESRSRGAKEESNGCREPRDMGTSLAVVVIASNERSKLSACDYFDRCFSSLISFIAASIP